MAGRRLDAAGTTQHTDYGVGLVRHEFAIAMDVALESGQMARLRWKNLNSMHAVREA